MERPPHQVQQARIGPFEVNFSLGELRKHGIRLKVHDQPLQVLAMLVARPGELVTREEIRQSLWPSGTFVDFDNGLNSAINRLREALGDSAEAPKFIETIPRRGYRFIAPVEVVRVPQEQADRPKRLTWVAGASAAVFALAVFGSWYVLRGRKPGVAFHARDWVLIANFDNRTGDPVLDGTLEFALERELSNSQFVSVVPRERIDDVLRLMRKPLNTKIDAALGREICLRDGAIHALLTGRVEKLSSTYVLSVELADPIRGVTQAGLSEEDPAESQLVAAVRRLSNRVRETLGEERRLIQQSEQRLEKVTTPSLHALQLYTQADESIRWGSREVAAELLERALQDDPDFASAHLLLGWAYETWHNAAKAKPHFERAFDLADFTTDRERFFILGSYYSQVAKDRQRAIEAYEALLQLYPDHFWGADNLTRQYFHLGRADEAARLSVRLADLRPSNLPANARAAWAKAIVQQDWNRARPYFQRASALVAMEEENADPSMATWVKLFPAYELWLQGNIPQAHAELIHVENTSKVLDHYDLASFFLNFGELKEAERHFQAYPGMTQKEDGAACVAFLRGDWPELKKHLRQAWSFAIPGTAVSMFMVRAGMWPDVKRAIRNGIPQRGSLITEGELALAQGDSAKGVSLLEEGLRSSRSLPAAAFFLGSESLAEAYRKQGKLDETLRVLLQASQERGRTYTGPNSFSTTAAFWMRTQLQLADLYREMGSLPEAEKIEDELLKLLVYADPDYPLLVQLKQRHRATLASFPR